MAHSAEATAGGFDVAEKDNKVAAVAGCREEAATQTAVAAAASVVVAAVHCHLEAA